MKTQRNKNKTEKNSHLDFAFKTKQKRITIRVLNHIKNIFNEQKKDEEKYKTKN